MRNPAAPTGIHRPARLGCWLAGVLLCGAVGWLPVWGQPAPVGDLSEIRARADKSDPEAQNALGNAYTNGLLGVKQDYVEALKWYRRAAEKGYAPAQFNLGLASELGRGQPVDERQAFKQYLLAAEQGFAAAQFNVGNMYSSGRGVGQDMFEANLWYKQAADNGAVEAQFNLGIAYEAGRGVKKDEAQAARWYKQAADRGFARAQYNLGLLLEDGRGVPKNEPAAASYYRAAAEQGFAAAQNNYGLMFSEGRGGLPKDPVQAYVWLSLAAANGANPAARDFVARSLSPDQLATALTLLDERKAGKPLPVPVAPPSVRPEAAKGAAPAPSVASVLTPDAARVAELTVALERARQANSQYAEANQWLELEKVRLEQELAKGGESGKLVEQLRSQSRRLAEQVQSLSADKDAAQRESAVLTAQLRDAQQELARAKAAGTGPAAPTVDVSKYEGQIAALTARLEQSAGSLTQLQQANQQLTETNTRLQKEKEAALVAAPSGTAAPAPDSDKDSIIASLQRDNARLNDEVKRSTIELLSLNRQIRDLRNRMAAKPAAPATVDNAANAEMRAENQRVDTNNTRLQEQRDAAVRDAETVLAQLREARSEIARQNEQIQQLRATRQSADAASDQLAQLTGRVAQATEEAGRLQTENSRLLARISELEKQPKPVVTEDFAPRLAQVQEAEAQLRQQVQALQAEKAGLEKSSRAHEAKLQESATLAQTAQAEAAELRQKLTRMQTQLDELGTSLAAGEQNTRKLEQENRSLAEKARVAEEALAVRPAAQASAEDAGRLRQQLAELQDRSDRLTRENQDLAEKVAVEQGNLTKLQTRATTLESELKIAQKQSSGGAASLEDLKKQLDEANRALEQSNSKVAELTAAGQGGQQTLAEANSRMGDLQKELAVAQQAATDASALRDELDKLKAEASGLAGLREEHRTLTAEAASLRARNEQLSRDGDQLASLMTGSRHQLEQTQARVTALENELREAQTKSAGGATGLEDLQKQLAETNQALEKSSANVAELTAVNDRLEQELAAAKQTATEAGALREEAARLRKLADEAVALRARNEQLTRDSEQLAHAMTASRRELDAAQARVAGLEKNLEEARTIRTHEGDDIKKLQGELAEANQSIEKLNATVAELTGVNDRLEKDLDSARKSTAAALAAQSQAVSAAQPDAYKMEISTLQAHIKELEGQMEEERSNTAREIATLASQLQRTRETNKSLTEANRALLSAKQSEQPVVDKEEFDRLQARVRDLTAAGDEMRRQNQKLAEDNESLTGERESYKQQLADARKVATVLPGLADEKAALQERLEAVGAQLLKTQQEVDALQKDNAEATALAAASKQAADKALADLAALQNRTTEAEKASESHNASVAELTQVNDKLEREREDMRRLVESYRADINRLTQNVRSTEQQRVETEQGAQRNIDAVTAQLAQLRRELEAARTAQARLAEASAAQDRDRVGVITQLRTENGALAARLNQAQGTLDQIAAAARLGTPAATIATGGTVRPAPVVSAPPPEVRYHTVAEGDSLSRISLRYYGTPNRWQEIFQANRDVLQGSSVLRVGMQLRIP